MGILGAIFFSIGFMGVHSDSWNVRRPSSVSVFLGTAMLVTEALIMSGGLW